MIPTIQSLQQEIELLKKELKTLNSTQGISRDTQTALANRLGFVSPIGTGTPAAPTVYAAFPVTVGVIPTKTLTIVYKGQTFHLLST